MKVVCFGDWHGNSLFAADALDAAASIAPRAHLIHVGDFGLWPGRNGQRFLDTVTAALDGRILHVVPGNHEYWPGLILGDKTFAFNEHDENGFLKSRRHSQIRVSPRTNLWQWGDATFAALSGANSIDYGQRDEGVSWWSEEAPTNEHVDDLVRAVGGRPVDVLITHDAPADAIAAIDLYPPERNSGWPQEALDYANRSAAVVGRCRRGLAPTIHVCGHHHVRRTGIVDGTRVEFLADDSGRLRDNRIELTI